MNKLNKISGAEAVIRCLIEEDVNLIYGYPGGAIMPIYDELYKFQDKLNHVLTRHEQGATHAAQGYARVSGKVGVVTATSGPGATNLVTGIADAQIDSTPMVCITGQVASHLLASIPHGTYLEFFHPMRDPIWHNMSANRPKLKDGYMQLTDTPGLGWELDRDYIKKYKIAERVTEAK